MERVDYRLLPLSFVGHIVEIKCYLVKVGAGTSYKHLSMIRVSMCDKSMDSQWGLGISWVKHYPKIICFYNYPFFVLDFQAVNPIVL